jgi:hypothetical protein
MLGNAFYLALVLNGWIRADDYVDGHGLVAMVPMAAELKDDVFLHLRSETAQTGKSWFWHLVLMQWWLVYRLKSKLDFDQRRTNIRKFCVIKPNVESPLYDTAEEAQAVADKFNADSHGFTYHTASSEIPDGHPSSETAQALESMAEQVESGRIERLVQQSEPPIDRFEVV